MKKMIKKLLLLIVALAFAFALVGCGGGGSDDPDPVYNVGVGFKLNSGSVAPREAVTLETGYRYYVYGYNLDTHTTFSDSDCKFTSSNSEVAAMTANGVLYCFRAGTTTLSVKYLPTGDKGKCIVTVVDNGDGDKTIKVVPEKE